MNEFTIHTVESAPEGSKKFLENSIKENGMIANLHGVMAEAPGLLEGYHVLHRLALNSSFSDEELTVVWQTFNVEHNCHYCVPAHAAIAHMMKVDPAITEALRSGTALPSEKLQVLHEVALAVSRNRGVLTEAETDAFYAVGYENRQLLEIVLVLSQKVMSNYVNHFAKTPIDQPFQKFIREE